MTLPSDYGSHCTLCSLLCAEPIQPFATPSLPSQHACNCLRRDNWFQRQAGLAPKKPANPQAGNADSRSMLDAMVESLLSSADVGQNEQLIWVDSADVQSMRSIVQYAQASGAVIHVGQNAGSHIVSRVVGSEGWLGTSLSEAAAHCDLVISLGENLFSSMPRLSEFLAAGSQEPKRWIHLGGNAKDLSDTASKDSESNVAEPNVTNSSFQPPEFENIEINSFAQLYTIFTSVLELQAGLKVTPQPGAVSLLDAVKASRKTVLLFDAADLPAESSESLLRRIAQLARAFANESKLAILALDSNPGRVTAEETLLWLTGLGSTVRRASEKIVACESQPQVFQRWERPPVAIVTMEQCRAQYRHICLVRSFACGAARSELQADLIFAPESDEQTHDGSGSATFFPVGAPSQGGYLFRADRIGIETCEVSPLVGRAFAQAAERLRKR